LRFVSNPPDHRSRASIAAPRRATELDAATTVESATISNGSTGTTPLTLVSTGTETYRALYTASTQGAFEITVVAIDGAGNRGTGKSLVRVPVAGDGIPPVVALRAFVA